MQREMLLEGDWKKQHSDFVEDWINTSSEASTDDQCGRRLPALSPQILLQVIACFAYP